MEFIDLRTQYVAMKSRLDGCIAQVLEHGAYIMGPEVGILEAQLAEYSGAQNVVTCANGTDALVLTLRSLGIGSGDAVITTPFTFFATGEAIALVGARPVFADIDLATFNIDPERLPQAVTSANALGLTPRAVMTVDLFGLPANYDAIEVLCEQLGLKLIEDAAQAFGGRIRERRAGSFGDAATTSFFPAKPLGCYGDGGAIFTQDANTAAHLRSLRVHGKGTDKYDNVRIGTNSRLDTIQAAILLEKLKIFPQELEARQLVAQRYSNDLPAELTVPTVPEGYQSSWAQYSVLARDEAHREGITTFLKDRGVPTMIYYAKPLHLQQAFSSLGYSAGDFLNSEDVSRRIFSLPMSPYLTRDDQDLVIECIHQAER